MIFMIISGVKKNYWIIFLIIFGLALILRTVNLEKLPYGFHVDEAKAAWNAFSIFKTGHDDKGNFLPLYYDSFGDFRPTGIIYSIIPFIVIFGNTVFAARFSSALFGALTIIPLMLLFWEIAKEKERKYFWIPGLLLAVNPWHIMVSRATSEVIIAMFLAIFAIYFFIKSIKYNKIWTSFLTLILIGISYLFYHNIRVLAPMFLTGITLFYVIFDKKLINIKKAVIIIGMTVFLTLLFFWAPQARGRLGQVSILSDARIHLETINMPNQAGPGKVLMARIFHNKLIVTTKTIISEYFSYFSTDFLVGDTALPVRYRSQGFGLITYVEILLLVLALAAAGSRKEIWIAILLLLISPIPAAITNEDVPNLHRALFMVPFLVLMEAYGFIFLLKLKKYSKFLITTTIILLILNLTYCGHFYIKHQSFGMAAYYRNGGAQELAIKLFEIKDDYKKIIISNSTDSLYPWFGYLNEINPNNINNKNWENVEFSKDKCPSEKIILNKEKINEKILIVDAEGCRIDPKIAQKENVKFVGSIRRNDLSEPYIFWEKN